MLSFLNCNLFKQLRNEAEAEGYPGLFKVTEYTCRRSCISFLIFRISVNAEESRQASNNFIVVMNRVWHSNYDLWFRAFLKCMTLWVKLALSSVKKKRTFRLSGMTET